jgi:hypothetical protein
MTSARHQALPAGSNYSSAHMQNKGRLQQDIYSRQRISLLQLLSLALFMEFADDYWFEFQPQPSDIPSKLVPSHFAHVHVHHGLSATYYSGWSQLCMRVEAKQHWVAQ